MTRNVPSSWGLLAGALALALVGFADDRRDLPALVRLGAQAATGMIVGALVAGVVGALLGLILYSGIVNVVNFMDGINGISALTVALWGANAIVLAHLHDLPRLGVIGAVTMGAALGFLPWNAPVARLFLGDVGSYLFGALVAGGILIGWAEGAPRAALAAPLAIYVADSGTTIIVRARRREPLLEAHRSHVYQRLTSSPCWIPHLLVSGFAATVAAVVTVAWYLAPGWAAALASLAAIGLYLSAPHWMVRRPMSDAVGHEL
nr:hypothetical protein [Pedococcus badiiscoriae]